MIGPSFLLSAAGGIAVGVLLVAGCRARPTVATLGAIVSAETLAVLVRGLPVGLFGFLDSVQTPPVPGMTTLGAGGVPVTVVCMILAIPDRVSA